ncbi:hypothetical protein [Chimaeribacter arupi]|nr:hypothetical protein [Chimaeribacter arupi]
MQTNLFKTDAAIRAACDMWYGGGGAEPDAIRRTGKRCRLRPERE